MKKKIIVLGMCALMVCGCGKSIPKLSNGEEVVASIKDGKDISVNELYNDLKKSYALNSLINLIDKKILEDKYKDNLQSANEYVDGTMKSYEEYYGDQFLSLLQSQTSFSSIEAFRDSLYIDYLKRQAITDYAKEQITEKEIKNYYEKNIYGDVLVNHILVTKNVKDDASEEDKNKADEEAKNKINTIITKLKESKNALETFKELAKEYSEDESTKNEGGSLGYINKGTLSSNYDELLKAAFNLKNGEFSTEIITTSLGYHVIFREDSKEKAKIEDVTDSIKETLGTELSGKDATISIKAMQELRKNYGVEINDSEIKTQYANYIQNALTQANQANQQKTE